MGEIAVGVIWQAVESHMVKIALLKESGRESFFRRHIINLLVNDLEGTVRVLVRHLIFVLLPAGLGVVSYRSPNSRWANSTPTAWASSGVTSPGAKDWMMW